MEPKLLPLVEQLGARYQSLTVDPKLINGLGEVGEQKGEAYVYRRPAFITTYNLGAGTARGFFYWSGSVYAVVNGSLFKDTSMIGAVANAGTYTFAPSLGANPVLFLHNGTNAYTVTTLGVVAPVTDVHYPAATVGGAVYLDGTSYVMDNLANVYGSTGAGNDPSTWDPLNLIKAQIEPTLGVFLAKQLVYVLALKDGYSEAFYDAGNAAGSPLAPVQGAKMNYGCVDGGTVRDVGGDLIWAANSGEGYPCVVMVSNLKLEIISTPSVERVLATATGQYYSWNCRIEGHRLYGLTSVGGNFTLVYDLSSRLWYQWTNSGGNYIPYFASCRGPGNVVYFLHATSGGVAALTPSAFTDSGDTPFACTIQTPNYDGGTRLLKVLDALRAVGDQVAGTTLTMQYSDDDYVTWSTPQTLDMSLDQPTINDLGAFTKRAFKFIHQANTAFRIKAVELYLTGGSVP